MEYLVNQMHCTCCVSPLNASNHYGDKFKVCKACWELYLHGRTSLPVNIEGSVSNLRAGAKPSVAANKEESTLMNQVPQAIVAESKKTKKYLFR